jgi:hypothetical protein
MDPSYVDLYEAHLQSTQISNKNNKNAKLIS